MAKREKEERVNMPNGILASRFVCPSVSAEKSRAEPIKVDNRDETVHNADFTMVRWFGTEYQFALGMQASAVRALWSEWENSGLGLHQDTIRDAIDSERDYFRMDQSFRGHPSFGTMIQRCGDGRYKLCSPGPVATPSPKKKSSRRTPKTRQ